MLIVTLSLFGLALVTGAFCSVWMLVIAFQRHVLWGLAVLLVPFAQLAFLIKEWEEAKRPFYWSFLALFFVLAGLTTMPKLDQDGTWAMLKQAGAAAAAGQKLAAQPPPKKESQVPGMFRAQREMELQIRLAALRSRENDLLERKAALAPGDREGAVALAQEIKKYNDDLKPVLEALREHPPKMTAL